MRRSLLAAFVLVPLGGLLMPAGLFSSSMPASAQDNAATAARACDAHCSPAWMDANLRIDQLQLVGTAESAKQRPNSGVMLLIRMGGKKDAQALDFAQPPIPVQLDSDARALGFDVAYDPEGGLFKNPALANMAMDLVPNDYIAAMSRPGFKVIHVLDVDYRSSCLALTDCLKQVAAWSAAHPRHLPITITLHTNDVKTPMPGATRPIGCDAAALDALEAEIRSVFTPDQIITPDTVQGRYPSLRDAALAHNWPLVGAARGKVMFVLDDSADKIRAYQGTRKSLEGRAMFVATQEDSPLAAFLAIPDPQKDGARIAAAAKAGFIVETRADEETREARRNDTARRDAAFASGAQIVTTDFLQPDSAIGAYKVSLADNPQALCGKRLEPEHCAGFRAQPLVTAAAAATP